MAIYQAQAELWGIFAHLKFNELTDIIYAELFSSHLVSANWPLMYS